MDNDKGEGMKIKPDFCPHCLAASLERARDQRDLHQLLSAILDTVGDIKISDRTWEANGGPPVGQIETFFDLDNRCRIIRKVKA